MVYGPAQAFPPQPCAPGAVSPAWLAATADRERAAAVLRAGFAEGRLSADELDERLAKVYASRTYGELWALTADLPAGPLPHPNALPALPYPQASPAVPPSAEPVSNWHSAAALVITALVIFTLAALVTAIATAHAQPMPLQQPFQHAQLAPFITHMKGP